MKSIIKSSKEKKNFFKNKKKFHYFMKNFSLLCTAAEFKVNKNNGLTKN